MRRLGDVVRNPQPRRGRQLALVVVTAICVPDLDDVERTLRGERDALKGFLALLKQAITNTLDHGVHKDCVGLRRINLLGPRSASLIFGYVPQWTHALFHEEEHSILPSIPWDTVDQRPELRGITHRTDLHIRSQRPIRVIRMVLPERPLMRKRHLTTDPHLVFRGVPNSFS
jgi:hypothetical protein